MDIKRIKIENLFGRYHHDIDLSESVKIIIGDNGVGKTVCLKIINSLFHSDFAYLSDLDFQSIILIFGNENWTITKEEHRDSNTSLFFFKERDNLKITSNLYGEHTIEVDTFRNGLPSYFEKISDHEWIDKRRGIIYEERELFSRYGIRYSQSKIGEELPDWIINRLSKTSVRFIDTQRIYSNEINGRSGIGRTISKYVKEISDIIMSEQNKASMIASQLDRTFPSRLLKDLNGDPSISAKEVLDRLFQVDKMTQSLHKVGLTSSNKDSITKDFKIKDDTTLRVLSLYTYDMIKKMEAYSDIQGKLELFLDIINSRFANKKCKINSNKEFYFEAKGGLSREIKPELLSSGEQNEFVLFYDLLFKSESNNFLLIDEPELSLHIKWQQMMIEDLLRVCQYNKLSILIATHSPDLIGNHWSLVQELD